MEPVWIALVLTLLVSGLHLASPSLRSLPGGGSRAFLSLAGGIAIGYVFLHLLPELQEGARRIGQQVPRQHAFAPLSEVIVFAVAFLGFLVLYALERWAFHVRLSKAAQQGRHVREVAATERQFLVHLGVLGLYSLLIGYTMQFQAREGAIFASFYALALALHLLVADHGLEEHYRKLYERQGHYLLTALPPLGWLLSLLWAEGELVAILGLALVGGGVILNVVKEEVPDAREGKPPYFILGALGYGVMLLVVTWFRGAG